MKELLKYLKEGEEGFSLLELVVAVGVIMVMTAGGVMAYGGITDNARQAAVEKAASEVFTGASAFEVDSDSKTAAKDAETQWNETSKKGENGDASIVVAVDIVDGCLVVSAKHVKGQEAHRQNTADCESTPAPTPGENTEDFGMIDADGNRYQVNVTFDSLSAPLAPNGGITGNFKNINGLPEGVNVHLSEWVTELPGFEALDGFDYVGSSNGMAEYVVSDTAIAQFDRWFGVYDNENLNNETYAEMWVEAPAGASFDQTPQFGHISESARGRSVWIIPAEISPDGMVSAIPAPRLTQACHYRPGILGVGARVRIFWEMPAGYGASDVKVLASKSGAGSELAELYGFDFTANTEGLGNSRYQTDVPTNLLDGKLGLSSELEIGLVIEEFNGDRSEPAIIATNAGLIGGVGGNCKNITE